MSTAELSKSELQALWDNRPDSIDELQNLFVGLMDRIDEEDMAEAFFVLRKAIEQFKPEESPNGVEGFRPYYYFRLKHHLSDTRRNEKAKTDHLGASRHFKQKIAFHREDARHYAETGEHLREDDYFADNKNYNVNSRMSRLDAAFSDDDDAGSLGDIVGEEDHSFDEQQFLEIFGEEEQDLIAHIVSGTPVSQIAQERFGKDDWSYQSKVRSQIFSLYNKVFNYYEGDTRFKTFFENVRSDIYSGDGIKVGGGASITTRDYRDEPNPDRGKASCRACGKKFKPLHTLHKDCSFECAVKKGAVPKSLTKDDIACKLKERTWGEVAFEYDRSTERIREWAWYFGIRNRKDVGAENWQQRYPQQLDGLPSRDEVLKAIETMAFSEMRENWGVNSEKTVRKWCSWYGLLGKLSSRPNRILSKNYKKNLKTRTKKLGRSNARIREARIARGWDPEVPKNPTREEMLQVLTVMPWSQMADHFQLSERKLMDLAKKYEIKHLRPRMIFSNEGAKNSAKGLKDSLVRGRKIPTKEELASDLASMTWNEMVDKWEWSDQWLKEKAKEYGIYDHKAKTIAAFDRITEQKHPMPSKQEFANMLVEERIYKLRRTLHRNENTIRRKAVEMGLRHLLEKYHRPTKRDLREKLKKYTRKQILDFYMIRPVILDGCIEEYGLNPDDYKDSVAEYQKKLRAEEKAKEQRRQNRYAKGPPKEEVEQMLLSPGISSTAMVGKLGMDLSTARKYVDRMGLGHLWPTRRAKNLIPPEHFAIQKPASTKKVCPHVDDLREALQTGGIQEAMQRFDLGYATAYRFARDCGLTKDGQPNTEMMAKHLSKEEIEAAMPGMNHAKLAEHFGVTKDNIKTRIRHLGIDKSLYQKPPFDAELFERMLETNSWQEIADAVGIRYDQAIYWAEKLGLKHKKCMVFRPESCSARARAQHKERFDKIVENLDIDQLRRDVQSMSFEKVARKVGVGRSRLESMCKEYGIERPTKESVTDKAEQMRKQRETWARKNNWPSREEIEPLLRDGKSYSEIARQLGRAQHLIRKICINYGIDHLCSTRRVNREITREDIQSCLDEGLSYTASFKKLNVGRDKLRSACKRFGMPEPKYRPKPKSKPKPKKSKVQYASLRKDEVISPVYRWQMSTTLSPVRLIPMWPFDQSAEKRIKTPEGEELAVAV